MVEGLQNPVEGVDGTIIFITAVSAALLLLIVVLMIVFLVRFNRKRHPIPADIRGNIPLEIFWTLVPTAIASVMFWYGWKSYLGLRSIPAGALEVKVSAMQFSWEFEYPEGKISNEEMVVPVGQPVHMRIIGKDVLHSVFIPAFRVKMDAIPGRETSAWFIPEKTGSYDLMCALYCGTGHADMLAKVRVVPREEYEQWLKEEEEW